MTDSSTLKTEASKDPVASGFIYENEHPQLEIPFVVRIGQRRFEGKTISITEAFVSGLLPVNVSLNRVPIALQFNFEGFTLSLFAEVEIEKLGDISSADHRLRFCNPSGTHLAPLRHIMNSHLAGDLVTLDRFLGYKGPTRAKAKTPDMSLTPMQRASRIGRKVGILVLSIGLIAMAANTVHDRVVFSYEPRPVVISQSGETLRATSAGQITYTNQSATLGDVIYSIGANSGDLLSVRMPCDCEIQPLSDFYEGATILAGTPLVKLVDADAVPEVNIAITAEGATRLISGDRAELEMSNGQIIPVTVTLPATPEGSQAVDLIAAELTFDPADFERLEVGETARLRFRRTLFR